MMKSTIRKILIANRGEIACRIIRTCKKLGIFTVSIYSKHDKRSIHVKEADEAVLLPGETIEETYLNANLIIQIAQTTNSDSIHPGMYNFSLCLISC